MKKTMLTRGFTLIELLVVIAIIGILAAVVIGSLNDARSSGQDASIKQSMANIRSQAELIYNSGGAYSYTAVCGDPRVTGLIAASLKVINGTGTTGTGQASNDAATPGNRRARCQSTDTAYIVETPLAKGVGFWCVDSNGASRQNTTAVATAMTCI